MAITKHKTGSANPKVYVALLNQAGTAAPVATVLENTLGAEVVWSRLVEGIYKGSLTNAFPLTKTTMNVTFLMPNGDGSASETYGIEIGTDDYVRYSTREVGGLIPSEQQGRVYVEIRVYP